MVIKNSIANNKGFSFLETLITLGIAMATISAISSQSVIFHKELATLKKSYAVDNLSNSITNVLSSDRNCLASFEGVNLSVGNPVNINAIYAGVKDQATGAVSRSASPLYQVDQMYSNIKIGGISLTPTHRLSQKPEKYLTEVQANIVDPNGTNVSNIKVPVVLEADPTSGVYSCATASFDSSPSLKEKACKFSGKLQIYDPVGDECVDKPVTPVYFTGNLKTATCGTGYTIFPARDGSRSGSNVCYFEPPPGYVESDYPEASRKMEGGWIQSMGPGVSFTFTTPEKNMCNCRFATDVANFSQFKCVVKCYQ